MQYIVLLRAINVGGKNKIKMAELKTLLEKLGFTDVATYIQSGNVVLHSDLSKAEIATAISEGIKLKLDLSVEVVVLTPTELKEILSNNPFDDNAILEANQVYFAFIKAPLDQDLKAAFQENTYPNDAFSLSDSCIYLWYKNGAGKAKLTNAVLERKLKCTATARNYRTVSKLIAMSS